ncbi:cytochrome c oxidase assembly protein [Nocardia spumae]|uniref:cytochrome c oxidase assembly protein n=1 Tax=Nocardia spumae TaxID=2887190 RepID=UPI001D14F6E2|nr:cytochrome c oxidase assembly protein [Nocardia spumae]
MTTLVPAELIPSTPRRRWRAAAVLTACLLAAVPVAVMVAMVGPRSYSLQGIDFPGWISVSVYVTLRVAAALAGGLVLGALAYTLVCTAPSARGRLDVDGYAGVVLAERVSPIWALVCLLLVPVSATDSAGIPIGGLLRAGAPAALMAAAERPKAWLVAAAAVVVVSIAVRFALTWNSVFGIAAVCAVAVLAPALTGNAGEGPDHDYATGAVVAFTLALSVPTGAAWCLVEHHRRVCDAESLRRFASALRRYRTVVVSCAVVLAPTGAILIAILAPPAHWGGAYGLFSAAAAAQLIGFAVLTGWLAALPAGSRWMPRALVGSAFAATGCLAVSAVLAVTPAPAFGHRGFTAQQVLLGFDLPAAPDIWRLLTWWRFDVVLGSAAIVAASAYLAGVVRLHRRGDAWSRWRMVSWVTGCVTLLLVTSSGIGAYSYAMFSVHMAVHMALNMFVPVLLVLGAPVTLLLRAVEPAGRGRPPGVREWVLWLMHSRFTRISSNPLVALAIFVVSLYGLYFTSLFDQLIRFHWGHLLMNIHFLLAGYLYYWAIIGIDPGPRRLPHLGRLGMLFAIMPFHAFFGVAVMVMNTLVGSGFYPQLQLVWMADPLADQKLGGTLAWISGEVPVLLVVVALLSQWATQERRAAARIDRHQEAFPDDDELLAYNAMLAQLARDRR